MFNTFAQRFKRQPADHHVSLTGRTEPGLLGDTVDPGDKVPLEPNFRPHFAQPRNDLAGFFSALREAAERFDMTHIAPLAGLDPSVRFQLRVIAVKATPDNDMLLRELQALQPQILKTAALTCLKQSKCAERFDLREFYGLMITAGEEVAAGEAVTTLATIGVERINLEFEFDGEHLSTDLGETPSEAPARSTGLTLRLHRADGRVEALPTEHFPLVIGTSPTADIRVEGTYVSREHATLFYDVELRRVVLQDHSRHGVWFNDERLMREGRAILTGSGRFCLSSPKHADAPVIEFSHAALDHLEVTPLTAPDEAIQESPIFGKPASGAVLRQSLRVSDVSSAPASNKEPFEAPVIAAAARSETPLRTQQTQATEGSMPDAPRASTASETQLAPAAAPDAKAYLQVRIGKVIETVPVTELPFVIGREPKGAGFTVPSTATYVSREHLCLVSFHHGHFEVRNGGLGRNNTYKRAALQDDRFLYRPVAPASDNGWMVLGGRAVDEKCVEVRLLTAGSQVVQ